MTSGEGGGGGLAHWSTGLAGDADGYADGNGVDEDEYGLGDGMGFGRNNEVACYASPVAPNILALFMRGKAGLYD